MREGRRETNARHASGRAEKQNPLGQLNARLRGLNLSPQGFCSFWRRAFARLFCEAYTFPTGAR